MLQVVPRPPVGQLRCCGKACCRRMHEAQPAPGESVLVLAIRRIALPTGILEEKPAELAILLCAPIVMESSDGQVRQDLLVDGTFQCCRRRPASFGDDRSASRSHALEP